MKIPDLPTTLDLRHAEALRKAFEYFYEEGNDKNFTDPETKLHFDTVTNFVDYLNSPSIGIPDKTSAKHIGITLERWYEILSKGSSPTTQAPLNEAPTQSNIPQAGLREVQEAERVTREAAGVASKEKAVEDAQKFIDQKQERVKRLQELLKYQKVNAKIEDATTPKPLPEEKMAAVAKLKEEASQNQKGVTEQLAKEIKTRIKENTPAEILDQVANQTAYDAAQALRDDAETSPAAQIAFLQTVATNPEVIKKTIQNEEAANEVVEIAKELLARQKSRYELSKQVFGSAFGKEAADAVFIEKRISLSETASPGHPQSLSLSQITSSYAQSLDEHSEILNGVKNLGADAAREQIGNQLGGFINGKIAALPEGHFLKTEFVSNTLSVFGVGPAVNWVAAEGASPIIKFAVSSGYGPLLGTIQSATGLNFGLTKLAARGVEKAAIKTGGAAVAKKGLAAALPKLAAALGLVGTPLTSLASWIATEVVVKVASWLKKFISKHRTDFAILGLATLLLGGALGSIPLMTLGGFIALPGFASGAALSGAGAGLGSMLFSFGKAFVISIGTPVIVALFSIPVITALILFIINSGAYVVPPTEQMSLYANFVLSADVTCTPDRKYCFPVAPAEGTNYPCGHHDYPAADIFRDGDNPGKGDDKPMTIVAYTAGVVEWVTTNNSLGGVSLMIAGEDGRYYYYAHNERNLVQAGARVIAGQPIALMDSTGNASGTIEHLHFGISKRSNFVTLRCAEGVVSSGCISQDEFEQTISYFVAPPSEFTDKFGDKPGITQCN